MRLNNALQAMPLLIESKMYFFKDGITRFLSKFSSKVYLKPFLTSMIEKLFLQKV